MARRRPHYGRIVLALVVLGAAVWAGYTLVASGVRVAMRRDVHQVARRLRAGMTEAEARAAGAVPERVLSSEELRRETGQITPKGRTGWYVRDETGNQRYLIVVFQDGQVLDWTVTQP